eukprot:CAMPEP_0119300718 /NCGR_PEP_ID=MMETSP1333-20130426/2633_1 /TAXON_ID=418940 /ORGANISM="Scyphosphaera apsteinii, Strain RCC1455" /LENGTH=335 /DNA_ID=CAMNT_0007302593 /DNA_START=115 /DNA_END=1122 /DNA_ORIENTATION=-
MGLKTSPIGLGCAEITSPCMSAVHKVQGKHRCQPLDQHKTSKLLLGVMQAGSTFFDTAEIYGSKTLWNEEHIGRVLSKLPRGSFTLATKILPRYTAEDFAAVVNQSLRRLKLNFIDLLFLHRMPPTTELLADAMHSLKRIVAAGVVRHIGLSEVPPSWLRRAHAIHPIAAVEMEWSLLTRNIERTVVPVCAELGIGVVAYSPLARTLLAVRPSELSSLRVTGWARNDMPRYSHRNLLAQRKMLSIVSHIAEHRQCSNAQLSLAWLYAQAKRLGVQLVAIPGTTNLAHALANIQSLRIRLNESEMAALGVVASLSFGARGGRRYMSSVFETLGGGI